MNLIGETIGPVLMVDQQVLHRKVARVKVSLPLNEQVQLSQRISVSLVVVIELQFKYKRLLGRCRDWSMINHCHAPCPRCEVEENEDPIPEPLSTVLG